MRSLRLTLCVAVLLTLPACASRGKPISVPSAPIAGCSERAPALRPPPPPDSDDHRRWAKAYIGAVGAYEDSENKRAATADCLDAHRAELKSWTDKFKGWR